MRCAPSIRSLSAFALALAATTPAAAQSPAALPGPFASLTQQVPAPKPPDEDEGFRARLVPRPGLRAGDWFRIDLRGLFQFEGRAFDPEPDDLPDEWDIPRRRVGIDGELFNLIDFQVEAQLDSETPWRDVYANFKPFPWLQFQGGKFKVPFGRERLRGVGSLDFSERSVATRNLTPGRQIGGMVHGQTKGRAVEYAVGFFAKDPDSVIRLDDIPQDEEDDVATAKSSVAGRVNLRPLRLGNPDGFRGLEVGFNVSTTKLEEGLNSLRGKSTWGYTFFPRVYVLGRRWRWGVDAYAEGGPASFTAEYLEASDDRNGQGLGDDDLPDLVGKGWYVAGSWVLVGGDKADVDRPKTPLFMGGVGALEVATRVESLRFGSRETLGEPPFRHPRAVNLYPNTDFGWTVGLNWYINRYLKLQGNAIRERFDDVERTPLAGEEVFWSFIARLQVAL